jgi:hypothetical protein
MAVRSALIRIRRDSLEDIGIRGLEIRLDGDFAGTIGFGKKLDIPVDPGHHELLATNTLYKVRLTIELSENEVAEFEVANVVTGLGKLLMTVGGGVYRVRMRRIS